MNAVGISWLWYEALLKGKFAVVERLQSPIVNCGSGAVRADMLAFARRHADRHLNARHFLPPASGSAGSVSGARCGHHVVRLVSRGCPGGCAGAAIISSR